MWTCKKCNEENEDSFEICWNCGHDSGIKQTDKQFSENITQEKKDDQTDKPLIKKPKYPALIILSNISKIFAWIALIISIILSIIQIVTVLTIINVIITLISGIAIFIMFLGASELIKLFIDIEKNTRKIEK